MRYPEIEALDDFMRSTSFRAEINKVDPILPWWRSLRVRMGTAVFDIWVDDEYRDLELDHRRLQCVLVLRELENMAESTDFLDWCARMGIRKAGTLEPLLPYYRDVVKIVPYVRQFFEDRTIHAFINDLDFELNAGAAQALRSGHIQ